MTNDVPTKAAVSLSEMAKMVGLSRSRFYQLLGATFPWPVYDITTHRPSFTEELQKVCLEVRRRNCGIDGQPILFYNHAPRAAATPRRASTSSHRGSSSSGPTPPAASNWLVDAMAALGLNVNAAGANAALRVVYPNGIAGIDQGEVIRAVFLHCRRQNSAGNVQR